MLAVVCKVLTKVTVTLSQNSRSSDQESKLGFLETNLKSETFGCDNLVFK
jgi:hypothetical protein